MKERVREREMPNIKERVCERESKEHPRNFTLEWSMDCGHGRKVS